MGAAGSSSASEQASRGALARHASRDGPLAFHLRPRLGFPAADAEVLHPERFAAARARRRAAAGEAARRRTAWAFSPLEALLADRARLKKLVRRGVPPELRPRLWEELSGAAARPGLPSPQAFDALVEDRSTEYMDRENRAAVLRDADRTMTAHPFFGGAGARGPAKLRRCLLAFVHHEPETGYLQSMNRVVALALLHYADDERRAFWLFDTLVDRVLPPDFYHKRLVGVQVAGQVFARLLQLRLPRVHAHLERHGVQPRLIVVPWFSCLFVQVLPVETAVRVWDCLMLEGSKILYRVALAMFKLREDRLLLVGGQGPLHQAIADMGRSFDDPDELLDAAFSISNLSRHAIEELRRQWLDHVVREMRNAGIEENPPASSGDGSSGDGGDDDDDDGGSNDADGDKDTNKSE